MGRGKKRAGRRAKEAHCPQIYSSIPPWTGHEPKSKKNSWEGHNDRPIPPTVGRGNPSTHLTPHMPSFTHFA